MKLTLIPQLAVKDCHPRDMRSTTDMEYARIATEVATEMAKLNIDDIPVSGIKLIALNVTMYFEDIIADAGIWRAFTSKMKEMYGRQLPFYEIDKDNYFDDEPNIEDVKLIIWYTMLEVHHGKIGNPENPILENMAKAAYAVLDRHFETAPANENLKAYFQDPQLTADFYKQREVLKWLMFACYLTYIPNAVDIVIDRAHEIAESARMPMDMACYHTESLLTYSCTIGPLRLHTHQWLAAILRANGNDEAAEKVGNQKVKEFKVYKIENVDADRNVTLRDADGDTFTVSREELNSPQDECLERKGIVGEFVEYDGKWHLNGGSSWTDNLTAFNEMAEDCEGHKELHPAYDKMLKESEGSGLFYFADADALKEFILKNLPASEEVEKNFDLPKDQKDIMLYIPADYGDLQIFPDGALCVKDGRNPYYNEKWARNQSLNFVLSVSPEVQHCLISKGLLPDATINSSKGVERGNEIVQENFDFLVRAVSTRL